MEDWGCSTCGACLDRMLTNRFLAYLVLAAVLYAALSCALGAARAAWLGTGLAAAALLVCLAVLAFILAVLEVCGYLARASFMADWAFRRLGLDGRALPSLILGIGCVLLARMVFAGESFSGCEAAYRLSGGESRAAILCAVYVPGLAAALWCLCLHGCMCLQGRVCLKKCAFLRHTARRDCHMILVMPEYRAPDGRSVLRCSWKLLMRFAAGGGIWLLIFYGAAWTVLS